MKGVIIMKKMTALLMGLIMACSGSVYAYASSSDTETAEAASEEEDTNTEE